mgnify:CR=1 FL=1
MESLTSCCVRAYGATFEAMRNASSRVHKIAAETVERLRGAEVSPSLANAKRYVAHAPYIWYNGDTTDSSLKKVETIYNEMLRSGTRASEIKTMNGHSFCVEFHKDLMSKI